MRERERERERGERDGWREGGRKRESPCIGLDFVLCAKHNQTSAFKLSSTKLLSLQHFPRRYYKPVTEFFSKRFMMRPNVLPGKVS